MEHFSILPAFHFDFSDFFRAFLMWVAVYFGTKHGNNGQ